MAQDGIEFLLNNRLTRLNNVNPNTTILQYLRNNCGKTGTKEGCASGDCGACTVVLAEDVDGQLQYSSLNACISLLPTLHGKQLITVEDLQDGPTLHPVQQAMVDYHGAQCGFCTPGFIMSLFALHKNFPAPEQAQTLEALAGNLCRCTGYRAIIDAAAAIKHPVPDRFDRNAPQTIKMLKIIHHQTRQKKALIQLSSDDQTAYSPNTLQQLSDLMLTHPQARLIAGGTDLVLEITQMFKELGTIIYVGDVAELHKIEQNEHSFTIGAAVTYSQFSPLISVEYPEFGQMIERIGSLQIRNQGTLGGNIGNASPIGDMPPVLLALNAQLNLHRANSCRQIAIEDYFIDYKVTSQRDSEFIQSIVIPKAQANSHLKVYKISKRFDDDVSALLAAFNLQISDKVIITARIAFGGMAAVPKRAANCEQALNGKPWSVATIESAMAALATDFTPLSDVRASADYRIQVAQNLLQKAYLEITEPGINTAVLHYA